MSSHAPRAYAVTNTWTGQGASTNGNWSAATNWGGTAPNGADSGGFTSAWNDGNSTFTITAIPEPSTYVAAIGLLALMLWPLRHRLRGKVS